MVESRIPKEIEALNLSSKVEGYYVNEDPKSIFIRLQQGMSFKVPKKFVDSEFIRDPNIKQIFVIDSWILRKIGFRL